jgi:hypothetical protein
MITKVQNFDKGLVFEQNVKQDVNTTTGLTFGYRAGAMPVSMLFMTMQLVLFQLSHKQHMIVIPKQSCLEGLQVLTVLLL